MTNFLNMTDAEKKARAEEKEVQLLAFLEKNGWTIKHAVSMKFGLSERTVARLLTKLESEKKVQVIQHKVGLTKYYSLSGFKGELDPAIIKNHVEEIRNDPDLPKHIRGIANHDLLKIAIQKEEKLLGFLATGEVWTTKEVVADLLQMSERSALRLLQRLVREKKLKVDVPDNSKVKVYGLTQKAIFETETAHPSVKEFQLGHVSAGYVSHHVITQKIRVAAERAGWTDWQCGKILMGLNEARLKKIPDSIGRRKDGRLIAIETENSLKSRARMPDIVQQHLVQIADGKYEAVYYFVKNAKTIESFNSLLDSIEFVELAGEKKRFADYRSRFKCFDRNNLQF